VFVCHIAHSIIDIMLLDFGQFIVKARPRQGLAAILILKTGYPFRSPYAIKSYEPIKNISSGGRD